MKRADLYRFWAENPNYDDWGRPLSFERYIRELQANAMASARYLSTRREVREYLRLRGVASTLETIMNEELKNPTPPIPDL